MKYYLAGPMSGIPSYNYPAFDEAAKLMRARGLDVVTPTELDEPETRRRAMASPDGRDNVGATWGEFLARDVKIVADDVKAVVLMPGWQRSRGARLEAYVGLQCNHEFYSYYGAGQILRVSPEYVRSHL